MFLHFIFEAVIYRSVALYKGLSIPTGLPSYRVQIAKTKTYAHSVPTRQLVYKIVGGYSNYTGQKRATEYWHECPCFWSSMTPHYNIRIQVPAETSYVSLS